MTGSTSYRLNEYKITENLSGYLYWEIHSGFAFFKRGNCFIKGNILFIEFSDIEESGFLKMEFIEQLDKLPKWRKTKYYCSNYRIYNCKTGKIPPFQEMFSQTHASIADREVRTKEHNIIQSEITEDISYRLGRYKIIEKNNGQVWWESHRRLNISRAGRCFTAGDILFMMPAEIEKTGLVKKDFMQHLNQLSNWTKTDYYCDSYSLYYCENGRICRDIDLTAFQKLSNLEQIEVREDLPDKKLKNNNAYSGDVIEVKTLFNQIDIAKFMSRCKKIGINILGLLKNWYVKRRKQ